MLVYIRESTLQSVLQDTTERDIPRELLARHSEERRLEAVINNKMQVEDNFDTPAAIGPLKVNAGKLVPLSTCDKTSVSPSSATNTINNSALSPLCPVNNDPSVTVTKEKRSSKQIEQYNPSPSKTFE